MTSPPGRASLLVVYSHNNDDGPDRDEKRHDRQFQLPLDWLSLFLFSFENRKKKKKKKEKWLYTEKESRTDLPTGRRHNQNDSHRQAKLVAVGTSLESQKVSLSFLSLFPFILVSSSRRSH